jgi:tetratricopeptide (TPR) repeat protein
MKNMLLQFSLLCNQLRSQPDNPLLYPRLQLLATLCQQQSTYRQLLQEILDETPYQALAWFYLGQDLLLSSQKTEALEAFEFAIVANGDCTDPVYAFVELAWQENLFQRAWHYLHEIEQQEKTTGQWHEYMGQTQLYLGNAQAASRHFKKACTLEPLNPNARFRLALCQLKKQEYSKAIHSIKQALALEESREEFHRTLAQVYNQVGDQPNALHCFRRAIDLAPDESLGWIELASYWKQNNATEEALLVLEEANQYTACPQLQYTWAACLFLLNRREEAWPKLLAALHADRSMLPSFFNWAPELQADGEILVKIGD